MAPSVGIKSPIVVPVSRGSSTDTISVCGSGRLNIPRTPVRDKVIGSYVDAVQKTTQGRRVKTEDVFAQLGEKVKPCNFPALRKSFRANDPRGKGRIPREAFNRVIWQHCGFVPQKVIDHILKRLGLNNQEGITFEEFVGRLAETGITRVKEETSANWIKPVANTQPAVLRPATTPASSHHHGDLKDTATKCWNALKRKVNEPTFEAEEVFPGVCFGRGSYVVPPQLCEVMRKLKVDFIEDDITKIFRRMEGASPYAVHTSKLFSLLGIADKNNLVSSRQSARSAKSSRSYESKQDDTKSDTQKNEPKRPWTTQGHARKPNNNTINNKRPASSMTTARLFSGDITKLFDEKLEECSSAFVRVLKARDKIGKGFIGKSEFRVLLNEHGIDVKPTNLEHFLMRNGLRRKDGQINYKLMIRRLQSRSNRSLLHKVMNNPDHCFHGSRASPIQSEGARASVLEAKLIDIFQKNFLMVLETIKQYDRSQSGIILLGDFRMALQERLDCIFSEDSWSQFTASSCVQLVPPPMGAGNQAFINYNDFLSKFDVMLRPSSADEDDPWIDASKDEDILREHKQKYLQGMSGDMNEYTLRHDPEPLHKLEEKLTRVFLTQFKQVKQEYDNIVREDLCRIDKEKFDYIMFRCGFILTASELSRLWLSLPITRPIESVSFPTLLQHLIKLHYANIMPRKFNRSSGDGSIMSFVMEKMRKTVIVNWKRLKEKLRFQDPKGTSRIPMGEMMSMLNAIHVPVLDMELHYLVWMLESRIPLKTNYLKFMEFFSKPRSDKSTRSSISVTSSEPLLSDTTSVVALRYPPPPDPIPQHGCVYQRKVPSPFISLRNAPDKPVFKRVTRHTSLDRGAKLYPHRYDDINVPQKFRKEQKHPYLSAERAKKLYRLTAVDHVRHPLSTTVSTPSTALGCRNLKEKKIPALQRSLRMADQADTGRLPVDEFKRVMARYGVEFKTQEDMYKLLSKYDTKMKNAVSYERYLKNIRL